MRGTARLPATCAIFCGGRSTRMGQDKALLRWRGRPLALAVASRLRPLFERVVVSGDPRVYARPLGLPCVADMGGRGPLAGLYSVLFAMRTPAVFAVACDMPCVEPAAVLALWERLRGHDVAAPVAEDGRAEPLHAFYARRVLPAAGRALAGKSRMVGFWGEVRVALVPVAGLPGGAGALADCDTPGELAALPILAPAPCRD